MEIRTIVYILILAGIGMLALIELSKRRAKARVQRIVATRPDENLETFLASFPPEVREIAKALYDRFQELIGTGEFPFRKSDVLPDISNADWGDIEGIVKEVSVRFNCPQPLRRERGVELRSIEDQVYFIYGLSPRRRRSPEEQVSANGPL